MNAHRLLGSSVVLGLILYEGDAYWCRHEREVPMAVGVIFEGSLKRRRWSSPPVNMVLRTVVVRKRREGRALRRVVEPRDEVVHRLLSLVYQRRQRREARVGRIGDDAIHLRAPAERE